MAFSPGSITPPGISTEKSSRPKRNCRTSTSWRSGVKATTFTQSGALMTKKSCDFKRAGCWKSTLCTSKMRVCAIVRASSFFQRWGESGCSAMAKKMPPRPEVWRHEILFREVYFFGMRIFWPTFSLVGSRPGFSASMESTRVANFLAIFESVSPGATE